MAEHTDPVVFWKGFVMGSLIGMIAAAYARADTKNGNGSAPAYKPGTSEPSHTFRQHSTELDMRREASENAGDPTRLAPSITPRRATDQNGLLTIERPSGNPGPTSAAEMLEVPGRPGRMLDHSDAAQRVESALRTHKVPASGSY